MFAADTGHFQASLVRFLFSLCFCVIALARANARKRLLSILQSKLATSAETAVKIEPKGMFESPMLKLLLRRGAVVTVPENGTFYLDEKKHAELCARDNKIRLIAFALLVLLAVVLFACI